MIIDSRNAVSQLLVDSSIIGILAFDRNFCFTIWNPGIEKIFGFKNSECIGRSVFELFPFLTETGEDRLFKDALKGKTNIVRDKPFFIPETQKSGYIESNYAPLKDEANNIIGGLVIVNDTTERVLATKELEESQQHFQMVAENMQDLVCLHDLEGRYLWVSPSIRKVVGYSPEELIGSDPYALFHPDDKERIRNEVHDAILSAKQGQHITFTYRSKHQNGSYIWFETMVKAVFNNAGIMTHLQTCSREINDKKLAQEELKISARKLSTLITNLPGMVYECKNDKNWTMEFASEGAYELTGYSASQFLDQKSIIYANIIHPDFQEYVWEEVQEAIDAHQKFKLEYKIITADQKERWVWEQGQGIYDNEGKVISLEGFITDITERKQAESDLKESEEQLAKTEEFSLVIRTHVSLDGLLLKATKSLCELLGYTENELINTKFKDITHPDDSEEYFNQCRKLIKGDINSFDIEERLIKKDGQIRWAYVNCSIVKDPKGNPINFLTYIKDITENKKAEEAIRDNENKYRTLTESSGVGVWQLDVDGNTIYMNKAMCKILGIDSQKETDGKKVWEFYTTESRKKIKGEFKIRNKGISSTYEAEVVCKDGQIRTVVIHGAPLMDYNGKLKSIIGTIVDVTEHKLTNKALAKSEERFRFLFEKSPIAQGISRNGITIQTNDAYLKLFGYKDPSEILGKSILEQIAPSCKESIKERLAIRTKGGTAPTSYETVGIRKDGTEFPFHVEIGFFELPDGLATIGYITDISESQKAELDLRKSEAKFRSVFESEMIGILFSDSLGNIHDANNAFLKLLGYTREELKDTKLNWKNITPIEYYQHDLDAIEEFRKTRIIKPFEKEYIKKDGSRVPVLMGSSHTEDHIDLAVTFVIDINPLKQSREELKMINKELNTFLYMASHDLKGPLASVIGLTEVAKFEIKDQISLNYLELINQCTVKLDKSLMNLMKVMKLKGDTQDAEEIDFKIILEEIIDNLRQIDGYNNVKFTLSVNINSPFYGDLGIINSVLQNLIENSIKYQSSLKDKPFVDIRINEEKNQVIIEIEDNGKGIDPNIKDRVFDMFYRGNLQSKGSGLGLYIVKNAIEKIKGTINFMPREKGGTIFTIILPKYG